MWFTSRVSEPLKSDFPLFIYHFLFHVYLTSWVAQHYAVPKLPTEKNDNFPSTF